MNIKFMFLNLPKIGDYINTINLHFPSLKFCSIKQKYLEKRIFFKYSMYFVHLWGINRHPMCIKILFLNSPNRGRYVKRINVLFFF